jgi:hypothetical protein
MEKSLALYCQLIYGGDALLKSEAPCHVKGVSPRTNLPVCRLEGSRGLSTQHATTANLRVSRQKVIIGTFCMSQAFSHVLFIF